MKKLNYFVLFLICFLSINAQNGKKTRDVIYTTGAPATCIAGKIYIDRITAAQYVFKTGVGCFTNGTGTRTTTTFTQGSVVFAGANGVYSQDNTKFNFDDTNNWLGIGIVPGGPLHVDGGSAAIQQVARFQSTSATLNYIALSNLSTGTPVATWDVWPGATPHIDFGSQTNHDLFLKTNDLAKIKINAAGGLTILTMAKPTCDATYRGTFWYVAGAAGVKDTVEVCGKDAANVYAWRTIY